MDPYDRGRGAGRPLGADAGPGDLGPNRCQVDGCVEDLSGLKRYFQRYHVCEQHMRAPVVLIAGRQVRFCDQCSTFHPLNFFDGVRRTCREKLELNRQKRRARKSQTAAGGGAGGDRAAYGPGPNGGGGSIARSGPSRGASAAQRDEDATSSDQPGSCGDGDMMTHSGAADPDDSTGHMLQGGAGMGYGGMYGSSGAGTTARKRQSAQMVAHGSFRRQPARRNSGALDVTHGAPGEGRIDDGEEDDEYRNDLGPAIKLEGGEDTAVRHSDGLPYTRRTWSVRRTTSATTDEMAMAVDVHAGAVGTGRGYGGALGTGVFALGRTVGAAELAGAMQGGRDDMAGIDDGMSGRRTLSMPTHQQGGIAPDRFGRGVGDFPLQQPSPLDMQQQQLQQLLQQQQQQQAQLGYGGARAVGLSLQDGLGQGAVASPFYGNGGGGGGGGWVQARAVSISQLPGLMSNVGLHSNDGEQRSLQATGEPVQQLQHQSSIGSDLQAAANLGGGTPLLAMRNSTGGPNSGSGAALLSADMASLTAAAAQAPRGPAATALKLMGSGSLAAPAVLGGRPIGGGAQLVGPASVSALLQQQQAHQPLSAPHAGHDGPGGALDVGFGMLNIQQPPSPLSPGHQARPYNGTEIAGAPLGRSGPVRGGAVGPMGREQWERLPTLQQLQVDRAGLVKSGLLPNGGGVGPMSAAAFGPMSAGTSVYTGEVDREALLDAMEAGPGSGTVALDPELAMRFAAAGAPASVRQLLAKGPAAAAAAAGSQAQWQRAMAPGSGGFGPVSAPSVMQFMKANNGGGEPVVTMETGVPGGSSYVEGAQAARYPGTMGPNSGEAPGMALDGDAAIWAVNTGGGGGNGSFLLQQQRQQQQQQRAGGMFSFQGVATGIASRQRQQQTLQRVDEQSLLLGPDLPMASMGGAAGGLGGMAYGRQGSAGASMYTDGSAMEGVEVGGRSNRMGAELSGWVSETAQSGWRQQQHQQQWGAGQWDGQGQHQQQQQGSVGMVSMAGQTGLKSMDSGGLSVAGSLMGNQGVGCGAEVNPSPNCSWSHGQLQHQQQPGATSAQQWKWAQMQRLQQRTAGAAAGGGDALQAPSAESGSPSHFRHQQQEQQQQQQQSSMQPRMVQGQGHMRGPQGPPQAYGAGRPRGHGGEGMQEEVGDSATPTEPSMAAGVLAAACAGPVADLQQPQQQPWPPHHQQHQQGWHDQQQGQQQQQGWPQEQERQQQVSVTVSGGAAAGSSAPGQGQVMSHVSMKLSHVSREELPSDLQGKLQALLRKEVDADVLQPTVREGCVEIVFDVVHARGEDIRERTMALLFRGTSSSGCAPAATTATSSSPCSSRPGCPATADPQLGSEAACAHTGPAVRREGGSARAAVHRLRELVGPTVFDKCERVTLQLTGHTVLSCEPTAGSEPRLLPWSSALHEEGAHGAIAWPPRLAVPGHSPAMAAGPCARSYTVYGPRALHADPRVTLLARMGHTHLGRVHVLPASTAQATATAAATGPEAGAKEAAAGGARTAPGSGSQAGLHSFSSAAPRLRALLVRGCSRGERGLGNAGRSEESAEHAQKTEPTACRGPVPSPAARAPSSITGRHGGAVQLGQGGAALAHAFARAVQLSGAATAVDEPDSGHVGNAHATTDVDQELVRAGSMQDERTAQQAGSASSHRPVSPPRRSSMGGLGEGLFAVSVLRSVAGPASSSCGSRGSLLGSGYSVSSRASSSSGGISLRVSETDGDSISDRSEHPSRILQLLSTSASDPPSVTETPVGQSEVQQQLQARGRAPEGGAAKGEAAAAAAPRADLELLSLQLPPLPHPGLLQLEAVVGHLVVACWRVAVLPTQQQADELCALCAELRAAGMEQELEELESDVALVLRSCCPSAASVLPPPANPHTPGLAGWETAGAGGESAGVRLGSVEGAGPIRLVDAVPDEGLVEPRPASWGIAESSGQRSERPRAGVHGHGSSCASLPSSPGPSGTECSAGVGASGVSGQEAMGQITVTQRLTHHGQQEQQQQQHVSPPVPDAVGAMAGTGLQDHSVALRAHTGPNPAAAGGCLAQQQEGLEVQVHVQAALGRLHDLLLRGPIHAPALLRWVRSCSTGIGDEAAVK